ncbi:MAG: hypothetical protein ACKOPS_09590 [Cyanobium sp.]
MGRRNALRLLRARLAGARTAPLHTPAGELQVRSWGTDVLMVADVLFRGDYAFPFPLLEHHRPGKSPTAAQKCREQPGS